MKTLRILVLFAFAIFAGSLFAEPAFAITSLTQSQVNNVCGSDLQTANGHSGCTKKCYHSNSTCIYDCSKKTGECNGISVGLVSTEPSGPKWPGSLLTHPTEAMMSSGQGTHHHPKIGGTGPTLPTGTGPTVPVDPDPVVIY